MSHFVHIVERLSDDLDHNERRLQIVVTDEGVIMDAYINDICVGTVGRTFEEWFDGIALTHLKGGGWIITVDHAPDVEAPQGTNLNAVGVLGPRDVHPEVEALLRAGIGTEFRLTYEAEEVPRVAYEGLVINLDDLLDIGADPLAAFGQLNAGCVGLEVRDENGVWTVCI